MILKWLEVLGKKNVAATGVDCLLLSSNLKACTLHDHEEGRKEIEPCGTTWTSQLERTFQLIGPREEKTLFIITLRKSEIPQSWSEWNISLRWLGHPPRFPSGSLLYWNQNQGCFFCFGVFFYCTKSGCCTMSHTPHLSLTMWSQWFTFLQM